LTASRLFFVLFPWLASSPHFLVLPDQSRGNLKRNGNYTHPITTTSSSSTIKHEAMTKLHNPQNEGIGYCQTSAKGKLKDFGDVDTKCVVHWSDDKKEVTGELYYAGCVDAVSLQKVDVNAPLFP
jgi:hypothetical protein